MFKMFWTILFGKKIMQCIREPFHAAVQASRILNIHLKNHRKLSEKENKFSFKNIHENVIHYKKQKGLA